MIRVCRYVALAAAVGLTPVPAWAAPQDAASCSSEQVVITATGTDAAAGHRAVTLNLALAPRATPCTLTGYPTVESGAGGPLIHARPTPRGYLGGLPAGNDVPPTVTLTPSQQGLSKVEGVTTDSSGQQCPSYTELRVSAPGTTEYVTVPVAIEGCQLEVHPITTD